MHLVFDFHKTWAYVAIVFNGLVGLAALVAWRVERFRGRWVWLATIAAGVVMLVQVALGVTLQASKQYKAPDFHIFYGVLVFLTVTFAYNYRRQLLRPTDERDTYLVYTRWTTQADFDNWVNSAAFQHGHRAHSSEGPVSNQSDLWSFDVVQHEDAPAS